MALDIASLQPLIGAWRSSGRTVDGVDLEGSDVYEADVHRESRSGCARVGVSVRAIADMRF
jgi:hypothetical protein